MNFSLSHRFRAEIPPSGAQDAGEGSDVTATTGLVASNQLDWLPASKHI